MLACGPAYDNLKRLFAATATISLPSASSVEGRRTPRTLEHQLIAINERVALMKRLARRILALCLSFIGHSCFAVEGGLELPDDGWEHAVQISFDGGLCSATIITLRYAITAAHCVDSENWSGEVNAGQFANRRIGRAAVAFVDPRYVQSEALYDVAVLKLELDPDVQIQEPLATIQSSTTYAEMLHAKSPHRRALVIGHGRDERGEAGSRKAAILENVTPFVGEREELWASHRPLSGSTLPGDSGGGFYMLRDGKVELAGVTSGSMVHSVTIEGDTFESIAKRYAPIAPSLCKAPSEVVEALMFDSTGCSAIEDARRTLSLGFDEADLATLLHMMRILNRSPQLPLMQNDALLQELSVRALILGSRSEAVSRRVVDYLSNVPSGKAERERWNNLTRALADQLIADGRVPARLDGQNSRGRLGSAITRHMSNWHTAARAAWYRDAKRSQEPCPFDNCLKFNEASPYLMISAADGNWSDVFPVETSSRKFELNGLEDLSSVVCLLADYLEDGGTGILDELNLGGVSEAFVSQFDSGESRTIKVDSGVVRLSGEFSPGFYILFGIENVHLESADIIELGDRLKHRGFAATYSTETGLTATQGSGDSVLVVPYLDTYSVSGWFQAEPSSKGANFGVWKCGAQH